MARYLSADWIDDLDTAARAAEDLGPATAGVTLVIQQRVHGAPDGDIAWFLDIADGSVRVVAGGAPNPDVTFSQDHSTAIAVGRGELSAQTAFMTGKLRVEGDVDRLMSHYDAFSAVEDVFGAVRADTEY